MFVSILLCVLVFMCIHWVRKSVRARPPVYSGALPIIGHVHKLLGDSQFPVCCLTKKNIIMVSVGQDTLHFDILIHEKVDPGVISSKLFYPPILYRRVFSMAEECNRKGGVIILKIGLADYYIITDPDDLNTAGNKCMRPHFTHEFIKPWLGSGLISGTDVSEWRRHRKLLSPAFGQHVLDGFMDIFNCVSKKMVDNLAVELSKGLFDHSVYLDRMSFESICKTAFGVDVDEVENFDSRTYMDAAHKVFNLITQRMQKWWLHSDYTYNLTKQKKELDEVANYLNDVSKTVLKIKRKMSTLNDIHDESRETKFKAFMDLVLELAGKGELTDREMYEEMNTIIAAGYETSGSALMYTLLLLGSHINVQNKVYHELQSIFGDSTRDVEKLDLSKLIYLEAVLKESLRIFTITPVFLRQVEKDVQLKNYTMPAGSNCLLFTCGLHRHPIWGNDADQFRPERWLENPTFDNAAVSKAFAGFGVGKRMCLGKTYSMMFMKTTLAHLLRRYRVISDVTRLVLKVDPLLKPVAGHEIALELRNNVPLVKTRRVGGFQ